MDFAASNGHLDVVKWLHANRHEGCTQCAIKDAYRNGHFEIVQWLINNRCRDCSPSTNEQYSDNYLKECLRMCYPIKQL